MPLAPGSRVGTYEIHSLLGTGGMGEVYRARDTKLDRDVAVKVLPAAVAQDPDRLTRFEREAKALAALNHPNIAQIYAVDDNAIVMELVPGVPLHAPLPLDTALDYAKQIASALEAAHERGIVHRDLKPSNVMVTPEGVVKVLDFGLAGRSSSDSSLSQDLSPTLTMRATQAGVIIGTAAYMSPEQAAGKPADKRADIWSFGVILWELLVGAQLFDGETISHTLADVLRAEIDFGKLPRETPPVIRQLLARCLDRDVKSRLRDIGEARVAVEKYLAGPKTADAGRGVTTEPSGANRRAALAWGVAALATAAAAVLAVVHFRERPLVPMSVRFQIVPPQRAPFVNSIVLSPDGERFVFTAPGPDGRQFLWLQSLNSLEARQVPGTEGVSTWSFWARDSRFIVFGVNGFPGRLKRVDANGGTPQTLSEYAGAFRGGDWNASGDIVFGAGDGIWRLRDEGGTPTKVTAIDPARRESQHALPTFLPDGRTFVYFRASSIPEMVGLYVGSLDTAPDAQNKTRLAIADSGAVFVPRSAGGGAYLLFLRQGTLVAQAIDDGARPTGAVTPLADDVGNTTALGWFSASTTGRLAYRTGREAAATSEIAWFDRKGTRLGQVGPAMEGGGGGLALSPDGKRVAVTRADFTGISGVGGLPGSHVWVAELSRGIFSRLTAEQASQTSQVITPDGRVVFSTTLNAGIGDLYWMPISGVGTPEPLIAKSPTVKHPNGVSPDGRFLIYDDHTAQRQDLWILPLATPAAGGDRKPFPFLATAAADETFGQFSPDGRWIAYDSDESGTREVYVQGFAPDRVPAAAFGKWQISTAGGDKPRWSRDGKELYYLAPDRKLMAVPVKIGSTFEPGVAVPLFDTRGTSFFPYDVAADGRFLVNTIGEAPARTTSPVTVVLNWQSAIAK